ncbi:unnamed protein product [Phytophthora fragariaefolia]|uniref:Unnamed protein product n=1 Tax=Phytophthora fragariaefolia TaxID=1490495 RepID=A0A9W7CXV0_9STRA|nr:unnamed protein product [Phytophthora fragariaefolia]
MATCTKVDETLIQSIITAVVRALTAQPVVGHPNLTLDPTNCELPLALTVHASDGICYPVTQDAGESVVQLDDQEVFVGGEAVEGIRQRDSPPGSAVGLAIGQPHDDIARTIPYAPVRWKESEAIVTNEVVRGSGVKQPAERTPHASDLKVDEDQSRVAIRGGGIEVCMKHRGARRTGCHRGTRSSVPAIGGHSGESPEWGTHCDGEFAKGPFLGLSGEARQQDVDSRRRRFDHPRSDRDVDLAEPTVQWEAILPDAGVGRRLHLHDVVP